MSGRSALDECCFNIRLSSGVGLTLCQRLKVNLPSCQLMTKTKFMFLFYVYVSKYNLQCWSKVCSLWIEGETNKHCDPWSPSPDAPEIHPDCIWHHGSQLDQVLFNCSWYGAYPTPTLTVVLDSKESGKPILNTSMETENFELPLNRSMLYEGQKITCVGRNAAQKPGDKRKTCTFTLGKRWRVDTQAL